MIAKAVQDAISSKVNAMLGDPQPEKVQGNKVGLTADGPVCHEYEPDYSAKAKVPITRDKAVEGVDSLMVLNGQMTAVMKRIDSLTEWMQSLADKTDKDVGDIFNLLGKDDVKLIRLSERFDKAEDRFRGLAGQVAEMIESAYKLDERVSAIEKIIEDAKNARAERAQAKKDEAPKAEVKEAPVAATGRCLHDWIGDFYSFKTGKAVARIDPRAQGGMVLLSIPDDKERRLKECNTDQTVIDFIRREIIRKGGWGRLNAYTRSCLGRPSLTKMIHHVIKLGNMPGAAGEITASAYSNIPGIAVGTTWSAIGILTDLNIVTKGSDGVRYVTKAKGGPRILGSFNLHKDLIKR